MKVESVFNIGDKVWFSVRKNYTDNIIGGEVVSVFFSKQGDAEMAVAYDVIPTGTSGASQIQVKEPDVFSSPASVADILIAKINAVLEAAIVEYGNK